MSQYGAYGYAEHGKDYRFILRHYYSGTAIGTLPRPQIVRVLLSIASGDIDFSGATSACGRRLDPARGYEAHRIARSVQLRSAFGRALANCGRRLRAAGRGDVAIGGSAYRGALEVVPTDSDSGSLNAVNAVPVDQYVKGVVPNESPASWPLAALEAQAVAARSYALSSQVDGNGFDLYADTRSQVYEGIDSEQPSGNRAAALTRGQVVMYGGKIAQTYFSACSGGHTESVQNVFFGPPVPYLVGVPDPYDGACPLHTWKLRFSGPQINAKLGSYLDGRLEQIVITKRGVSPRIVAAKLIGTGGTTNIRGDQLASALGAYDRWMSFRKLVNGKPAGGNPAGETDSPPGPAGGVTG
jgi:stage II sporulation protein D